MQDPVQIRLLGPGETPPMALLLLADPSAASIASYIRRGTCRVAERDGLVVGEYVLLETRPETVELVNVAVAEPLHGRGIGKALVLDAIAHARGAGFRTIELGTGNSGVVQLALYQKCGFRIVGVDPDFFTRRYPEPILENGILCRDMVRLALELQDA